MGEQEDQKEGEEMLYVPFEEGLFLLIDENFYVIDCNDPNQRSVRIMDFFDGGNSKESMAKWESYLAGNETEAWSLEFIVSTEQVDETDIDENGNEIDKSYIKQSTQNVAILFRDPQEITSFDSKVNIPDDAFAAVVILPECTKFEAFQSAFYDKLSAFTLWLRMMFIAGIDDSMYCDAMDLMNKIQKIRNQLDAIDENEEEEPDLIAYYESQRQLLHNVPVPNKEQLDRYSALQNEYQ